MKIAIVGAGNMGMAFAKAFVTKNIIKAKDLLLIEPRLESHVNLRDQGFETIYNSIDAKIREYNIIILAVKPQDFQSLAKDLKDILLEEQVVLSLMAGISIETIAKNLKTNKIVRCMPNTPAKLGVGVTGYFPFNINPKELNYIKQLLESTGVAIELDKESLLNAVTALSGSGPAYFYFFLKSMISAGISLGLSEKMAHILACETMHGSYQLLKESDTSLDELIKAVTSKGGTTEAALSIFTQYKIAEGIEKGVTKAENRAKELSQII